MSAGTTTEPAGEPAPLDERLLPLLACPVDKDALLYLPGDDLLYNPRLRRGYRVETGIPILLADEAEQVSDERHVTLVAGVERGEATATLGRDPAELVKDAQKDVAGIE